MSKWRVWWLEVLGNPPSEELVAATEGLSVGDVRRARRLVRRGQAANDAAVARCAIALACERLSQDKSERPLLPLGSFVMGVAGGGAAVVAFARSDYMKATVIAVVAAYVFYFGFLGAFRAERNAKLAERLNREVVMRAGVPYFSADTRTLAYVHPVVAALLFAVQTVLFMPIFGVVTLLVKGEVISPKSIVSAGLENWLVLLVCVSAAVGSRIHNQRPHRRSAERRPQSLQNKVR